MHTVPVSCGSQARSTVPVDPMITLRIVNPSEPLAGVHAALLDPLTNEIVPNMKKAWLDERRMWFDFTHTRQEVEIYKTCHFAVQAFRYIQGQLKMVSQASGKVEDLLRYGFVCLPLVDSLTTVNINHKITQE